MATMADWLEGARPKTLPAALSPVLAGSGVAWFFGSLRPGMAGLAFVVALAMQIGVNFANDYSDGIRGTDEARVGPKRLVASGAATPRAVRSAAFGCFGMAAAAGVALVAWSGLWWLVAVGVACILAAWFYTGGAHPYGYAGLGELFVFIFFGLVAVGGTALVQLGWRPFVVAFWPTFEAAVAIGALACALLVTNNLRDLAGDAAAGKRTLATRLGDLGTRWLYVLLVATAAAAVVALAMLTTPFAALGLLFLVLLIGPLRALATGAKGMALIGVLRLTGLAELACAVGLFAGLALGAT